MASHFCDGRVVVQDVHQRWTKQWAKSTRHVPIKRASLTSPRKATWRIAVCALEPSSTHRSPRRVARRPFLPPSHPKCGRTTTNDGRICPGVYQSRTLRKLVVRFENTRETFYQRKCREKTIDPDTCSCHRQTGSLNHFRVPLGSTPHLNVYRLMTLRVNPSLM